MSKSAFRKRVSKELLKNFSRQSEKTVGQAARILLQSAEVSQCIVLKNRETKAIQTGFEAGIERKLTAEEGTKYRAALKSFIKSSSLKFPAEKNTQTRYFLQLVKNNKLTFGKNIFYMGVGFDQIKERIHKFNTSYIEKLKSVDEYSRDKYGATTHLDHGADGNASGLVGSVLASFSVADKSKKELPKNFKKIFSGNLEYVLTTSLSSLSKGQRGKIYSTVMKLVSDAQQIISKQGDFQASLSMILTPVLADVNIKRGSQEEKQIQEAFLNAFEMTFTGIEYENLKGSSTLSEKIEHVIVHDNFLKAFKDSKIKTDIKAKKVKTKTKTKLTDKTEKGSGTRVSSVPVKGSKARAVSSNQRVKNKQSRSMFSVMSMINQKLPETVQKNMKAPGLENRTGRFAGSVRLTEVSATRQNFPSFGYTYDKEPYQVFEMGRGRAPWATPERDPRKVIDASVREIAAQMALGRFYTRRV